MTRAEWDTMILQAKRTGDLAELLSKFRPILEAIAISVCPTEIEDAIQIGYIAIWRSLPKLNPAKAHGGHLRGYLLYAARSRIYDMVRKTHRRLAREVLEYEPNPTTEPDHDAAYQGATALAGYMKHISDELDHQDVLTMATDYMDRFGGPHGRDIWIDQELQTRGALQKLRSRIAADLAAHGGPRAVRAVLAGQ